MRLLLVTACEILLSPLTPGRASSGQDQDAKAKEELRKLFVDYNEAGSARNRAAVERLFGDGADSEMTFRKDENGQATHVTLRLGTCQESEAKRVE